MEMWHQEKSLKAECPWGGNPLPGGQYCPNKWPCCQTKGADNMVPIWGTENGKDAFDPQPNLVTGTVGEQFPPGVERGGSLKVFNDIAMRQLLLTNYDGEEVHWKGTKLLRFNLDKQCLDNAQARPSQERFYLFGPSGFFANLSLPEEGIPVLASLPHFLYGDPALLAAVEGIRPDAALHSLTIDVEPISGSATVAHQRAMISVALPEEQTWVNNDDWFPTLPHGTIVPILWFDDYSYPTQEGLQEVYTVYLTRGISKGILGGSIGCSVLFAVALAWSIWDHYRSTRTTGFPKKRSMPE